MATEMETRHTEKTYLLQMLFTQLECSIPQELDKLIMWAKARMEPEDVKLVLHEFEEWKKNS